MDEHTNCAPSQRELARNNQHQISHKVMSIHTQAQNIRGELCPLFCFMISYNVTVSTRTRAYEQTGHLLVSVAKVPSAVVHSQKANNILGLICSFILEGWLKRNVPEVMLSEEIGRWLISIRRNTGKRKLLSSSEYIHAHDRVISKCMWGIEWKWLQFA